MINTYAFIEPAAFVITPEIAVLINKKYYKDDTPVDEIPDDLREKYEDVSDAYTNLQEMTNLDTLVFCSDFTGTAAPIRPDLNPEEIEFYYDFVGLITANKHPSLFEKAYKDFDELANEFKGKISHILPDDFPIEKYIYSIDGTFDA